MLTWKCRMTSLLLSARKNWRMLAHEALPRGSKPPLLAASMMTGTVAVCVCREEEPWWWG